MSANTQNIDGKPIMSTTKARREARAAVTMYRWGGGWVVSQFRPAMNMHEADAPTDYYRALDRLRKLRQDLVERWTTEA